MQWKGKTVFLTGASSGIGEGIALALAKKGAVLGLVARREDMLADLAKRCEDAGGTARYFPCDVVDAAALQVAAEEFRREFARVDVMIANAGVAGANKADKNVSVPW